MSACYLYTIHLEARNTDTPSLKCKLIYTFFEMYLLEMSLLFVCHCLNERIIEMIYY